VLGGEQRRGGAARHADLRVDVLHVVTDGLRRDLELSGDLLVEQPAREQPQDLDLARREPGRPLRPSGPLVAGGAKHLVHYFAVEPTGARLGPQRVG
jgi:hypothetical protein